MHHITIASSLLAIAAIFAIIGVTAARRAARDRGHIEAYFADTETHIQRVDPWEMQRDLMSRSGQRVPAFPALHNGVILYALLNMEELGEMLQNLSTAVAHHCDITIPRNASFSIELRRIGELLRKWSKSQRDMLAVHDIGHHVLSPKMAKALFDDTTDLMVTNSGFALSCGFPGADGYAEVANSNLSKVDPETGKIEKTQDGKWIKGPNYFEPDLLAVLVKHSEAWANHFDQLCQECHGGACTAGAKCEAMSNPAQG